MVDLSKASPRPWKRGQEGNLRIYAKDGMADRSGLIAKVFRADDIDLIVEAVNAYSPTREALEAAREWQPIETAPKGTPRKAGCRSYKWMILAVPDDDGGHNVVSGMNCDGEFFASLTFHRGGSWETRQFHAKEVQVYPTHWMPLPEPPALAKIAQTEEG